MRIVTVIIAAIRERVRSDFAIGVAVNADESTLGANGIDVGIAHCRILEETGMVDWLRITSRGQKPQMTQYPYTSSYIAQEGTHLNQAAAFKNAVRLTVSSCARILTSPLSSPVLSSIYLTLSVCIW